MKERNICSELEERKKKKRKNNFFCQSVKSLFFFPAPKKKKKKNAKSSLRHINLPAAVSRRPESSSVAANENDDCDTQRRERNVGCATLTRGKRTSELGKK